MAYSIKGIAIVNDSRELLGVNTAGINTALYVGDLKIEDNVIEATSGVVTYVGDGRSLTGIVTVSDAGGTPEFSGNLSVDGQLSVTGLASLGGGVDVTGHIEGDSLNISGISTLATLVFNADPTLSLDGVTDDLTVEATASQLVTAEAAKAYADSIVGAGNTLEFIADTGSGEVDLVTDTFVIDGTPNQVESTAAGAGVTFAISSTLQLPGTLAFGAGDAVNAIGVGSDLGGAGASDSVLPTQKAVKDYVDNVEVQVEANANLDLATGGSDFGTVGLATQSLAIEGTALEVSVTGAGQTFTIGLPDSVVINDGNASADGGLQVSGITTLVSAQGLPSVNDLVLDVDNSARVLGNIDLGGELDLATGLPGSGSIRFKTNGGSSAVQFVGLSTALNEAGTGAADNTIPTELAVKTYVDAQLGASNQLTFLGDATGATTGEIELSGEDLSFVGAADQLTASVDAAGGNQITFALRDDVKVATSLIVAEGLGANAGNLLEVNSTTDVVSVDGQLTAAGLITGSEGAQITGICTATDFNSTSDINKKENIVEIADAVEKVEALRGVTFDWKDGSGKSGGIIAQEVQAVLPEIVKEGEHLTVNYNGLTGLLIQAVKELSARVAELEAKN